MTQTLKTLALAFSTSFVKQRRVGTGEDYLVLRDDAPEWMRTAVIAAHGDLGPNDWRYQAIREALEIIAEDGEEAGTPEPDVYNHELATWLSSSGHRWAYCDEQLAEPGFEAPTMFELMQAAQGRELVEIRDLLLDSLRTQLEGASDE